LVKVLKAAPPAAEQEKKKTKKTRWNKRGGREKTLQEPREVSNKIDASIRKKFLEKTTQTSGGKKKSHKKGRKRGLGKMSKFQNGFFNKKGREGKMVEGAKNQVCQLFSCGRG